MKPDAARDLAVKLFGLYCAARFAVTLPQVFTGLFMREFLAEILLVLLATSLAPAVYLGLAWACLFKTDFVCALLWRGPTDVSRAGPSGHGPSSLSFWITLVGFFYFIRATAGLLSQWWLFWADREMLGSRFWQTRFLPDIFLFPLSILCILMARRIERFILDRQMFFSNVSQDTSDLASEASSDEPST